MQILQVNLGDYIPRYQIFVQQEKIDKLVQHWMQPATLWDGRPVIGCMADSYLDDLQTVGFKHFNPMWNFPTTAVYQNWERSEQYVMCPEQERESLVPANPADRTDPKEKAVPWRDIGDLNKDVDFLYSGKETDTECPVPKNEYLRKDQQLYMQWIEQILDLDRRTSKDPR